MDLPADLHTDTCVETSTSSGTSTLDSVHREVDGQHGFEDVLVTTDGDDIIVTDVRGEVLVEHAHPSPA